MHLTEYSNKKILVSYPRTSHLYLKIFVYKSYISEILGLLRLLRLYEGNRETFKTIWYDSNLSKKLQYTVQFSGYKILGWERIN